MAAVPSVSAPALAASAGAEVPLTVQRLLVPVRAGVFVDRTFVSAVLASGVAASFSGAASAAFEVLFASHCVTPYLHCVVAMIT
jgi:hypothetical protein